MSPAAHKPGRAQRGGFFFGLIVAMAVIAALIVLAWIIFLPRVVTKAVSQATGLSCDIERLHANPFTGSFRAEGVRLGNPAGWGDEALAEVIRLEGEIDMMSLRQSTLIVESLEADVARFVIVIDDQGRTNLESIAAHSAGDANPKWAPSSAVAASGLAQSGQLPSEVVVKQFDLYLQRLEVVDQAVVPSRRMGDDLEYRETYLDVREARQLLSPQLMARLASSPVLFKMLMSSGLLGGDSGGESGVRQLWDRAADAVNSFLQGLEQKPKP